MLKLELISPKFFVEDTTTYHFMLKAERLLDLLLDAPNIGICIVDHRNKIVEVNNTYCGIYEYNREELINQSFTVLKPKNYRDRAHLSYQGYMEGGQRNNVRQILTKKGNSKSVQLSISNTEDESGRPFQVYSVVEVPSASHKVTRTVADSQIAESVKTALLRVSPEGTIRYANSHARTLFCLPAGTNKLYNELTYYTEEGTRKLRLTDFLNEQRFLDNQEILLERVGHVPLWAQLSAATVMHDGHEVCFDVALVSLEAQKLKERKLKREVEDLKATNKHLDHFVYGATHDLKAPLASLSGLLHIMRRESDPEQKELFMQMMEKSIHRLNEFIREIVDYSRNANQELKSEKVYFEPLIKEIFESMEHMENAGKISQFVSVEQPQPFYTDSHRLKVVLNNLISNAYKYSSTHRRDSFIRVSVNVDQQQASLRIEDNGQGIGKDHIEKIFEMFFRASEGQGGSGLGLYIVKETLDKMQGSIHVVSEQGKGTCFVVSLPSVSQERPRKQLDLGI